MRNKAPGKKRLWVVFGGIAAALALAILALVFLADVNRYKPRLESAASKALGLEVRIRGEMNIEFFPSLGLSLAGIEVHRDSEEVLRVDKVQARLKILPLLWGQVHIRGLGLVRPALPIQRTSGGPFDFERYLYRPLQKVREGLPGTFDRLEEISATGGKVSYVSNDHATRMDADGIDLAIRDIDFGLKAKNGNYEIQPVTLQAFDGTGEGSMWVHLAESIPLVQAQYSLKRFRVEQLFAGFGRKRGGPHGDRGPLREPVHEGGTPKRVCRDRNRRRLLDRERSRQPRLRSRRNPMGCRGRERDSLCVDGSPPPAQPTLYRGRQ